MKNEGCRGIPRFPACQRTYDLAPLIYEGGVAEGRGEPEYLHSKYSEIPTFLRKVGTPSALAKSRLRRLLAARSCGRSDLASLGHLKVNCPMGKRGHSGVPP